jgi:hypothetical protein
VRSLDLYGTPVTGKGLKELAGLKQLHTLDLPGRAVTDVSLASLREAGLLHALAQAKGPDGSRPGSAAGVRSFDLHGTRVTGKGLKELAGLEQLRSLSLPDSAVQDGGLKELVALMQRLKNLRTLDLPGPAVTDVSLASLREAGLLHALARAKGPGGSRPDSAAGVRSFDLGGTRVTGKGLKELAGLEQLRSLSLPDSALRSRGLKELAGLKHLQHLALPGSAVTDEALVGLRQADLLHLLEQANGPGGGRPSSAADVRSLDLSKTNVTGPGLKELAAFTQLESLSLGHTQVGEIDAKELAPFKHLRAIQLTNQAVTNHMLATLREARMLHLWDRALGPKGARPRSDADVRALDLAGTTVSDVGLVEVVALKQLEALNLNGTRVTNRGMMRLTGLKRLRYLGLKRTKVGDYWYATLEGKLPGLKIGDSPIESWLRSE